MLVNVDNFVRAETDRMFTDLQRDAGGVNVLAHNREPATVDHQTVIRLNRDTLYSFAVVDISDGATVTIPDHDGRYVSVMVVNQDHYVDAILHDPGEHRLTIEQFDTRNVAVAVRILVDPTDADDVRAVRCRTGSGSRPPRRSRTSVRATTRPASTRPASRCSRWRAGSPSSTGRSGGRTTSTRFVTSSAPRPDGEACRPKRPPTSGWHQVCPSGATS